MIAQEFTLVSTSEAHDRQAPEKVTIQVTCGVSLMDFDWSGMPPSNESNSSDSVQV